MDVRMPDGTIIRGVPEGTPKDAILAKYQRTQSGAFGKIDAAVRGLADTVTFGLADELAAGVSAPFRATRDAIAGKGFSLGKAYDEGLAAERATDAYDTTNAPVARGAGQVAGALVGPGAALGASARALPRIAGASVYGAGYGFGSGEGGVENRLKSAAIGAVTNAAGGEIGRGLVKAVSAAARGIKTSAPVQALMDSGVPLTIGQKLGGFAKQIEDGLENTLPFGGKAIAARRNDSVTGFNRATIQKVLEPIGVKLPMQGSVQDLVGVMQRETGAALDRTAQNLTAKVDAELSTAIQGARAAAAAGVLPEAQAKQLDAIIANNIERRFQGDTLAGREFQKARSELRRLAGSYGTSAAPGDRELGDVLGNLAAELERAAERHSPAAAVDAFRKANEAFALRVRVERAAAAAANAGEREAGAFTPGQLLTAVRQEDKTARKGAMARGDALLQQWAQDAQNVIPSRTGNSGTADRATLMALAATPAAALGLNAAGADPSYALGIAGAGVAGRLAYSPLMQRQIANALFNRSPLMRQAGNRLGQVAAPVGAGTGALLLTRDR